jgi:hypothetical protein
MVDKKVGLSKVEYVFVGLSKDFFHLYRNFSFSRVASDKLSCEFLWACVEFQAGCPMFCQEATL